MKFSTSNFTIHGFPPPAIHLKKVRTPFPGSNSPTDRKYVVRLRRAQMDDQVSVLGTFTFGKLQLSPSRPRCPSVPSTPSEYIKKENCLFFLPSFFCSI